MLRVAGGGVQGYRTGIPELPTLGESSYGLAKAAHEGPTQPMQPFPTPRLSLARAERARRHALTFILRTRPSDVTSSHVQGDADRDVN